MMVLIGRFMQYIINLLNIRGIPLIKGKQDSEMQVTFDFVCKHCTCNTFNKNANF